MTLVCAVIASLQQQYNQSLTEAVALTISQVEARLTNTFFLALYALA